MQHKFENGTIDYRYPNAIETMKVVRKLSGKEMEEHTEIMMGELGSMIEKINVKHKGKKIKDYDSLFSCPSVYVSSALIYIASDVYNSIFVGEEEKK